MVETMIKQTLVLYHAGCPDGFCAAWAFRKFNPDAEFMPVRHGDPPPDVKDRSVVILDFSYKRNILFKMAEEAYDLILLDHHKTAKEDLEGLDFCKFDMEKSGAKLTWDKFLPLIPMHWLVHYTEDRDLWLWRLPESKEVSASIASYPRTFEAWDILAKIKVDDVALEGKAILRYKNQLVTHAVAGAIETELDGHKILVANCSSPDILSEVGGELARGRPFGACWHVSNGKKKWSLRSRDEGVDVSQIAKKHGGGGHRNAAGFEES